MKRPLNLNKELVHSFLELYEKYEFSHQCASDLRYAQLIWETIFYEYFRRWPQDPHPIPKNMEGRTFRYGSLDRDWDALLHTHGGLDAQKVCLRILRIREHTFPDREIKVA